MANRGGDASDLALSRKQSVIPTDHHANFAKRRLSNALSAAHSPFASTRAHHTMKKGIFMTAVDDSVDADDETLDPEATSRSNHLLPPARRLLFENSYRILPEPSTKFNVANAKNLVDDLLTHHLQATEITRYDPERSKRFCIHLANLVRRTVRHSLHIPRYKIVAYVVVGQNIGQDFSFASRCLWYPITDNFVQSEIKAGNMFAVCTVFALYYE